jgi:hypothetical protein
MEYRYGVRSTDLGDWAIIAFRRLMMSSVTDSLETGDWRRLETADCRLSTVELYSVCYSVGYSVWRRSLGNGSRNDSMRCSERRAKAAKGRLRHCEVARVIGKPVNVH